MSGFIEPEKSVEDLDIIESNATGPSRGKRRTRQTFKATKRVPVRTRKVMERIEAYFEPHGEVETQALGLDKLVGGPFGRAPSGPRP